MKWSEALGPNPYHDGIVDRHDGLSVETGWGQGVMNQLVNRSRHDSVLLDRFTNSQKANEWYTESRPRVYSLLGRQAMTGLAGVVMLTPMDRVHVAGNRVPDADYLFEQQMFGDYVPHGKPGIMDSYQSLALNLEQAALFDFIGTLAADGPTNFGAIGLSVDRDEVLATERHTLAGFIEQPGTDESRITMVRTWQANEFATAGLLRVKRPNRGPLRSSHLRIRSLRGAHGRRD